MKNKIFKILSFLLILPVVFLTSCRKKSSLPAIDLATYMKDDMKVTYYQIEAPSNNNLSNFSTTKLNKDTLAKYTKLEFSTDSVWMYKMYIESISFYVYTTLASSSEMIVNVSITNMSEEKDLLQSTEEEPNTFTATEQCTFIPKSKNTIKCTFNFGQTIATSTGATITVDILNSLELFDNNGEDVNFEWTIYGFEIHGESRAYSKK